MRALAVAVLAVAVATAVTGGAPVPPASAETPPPASACRADALRLCAEVPRGVQTRILCLVRQPEALSPECRAELEPLLEARERSIREACHEDAARLCAGAASETRCLHEQEERLSPGCRDALAPPAPR